MLRNLNFALICGILALSVSACGGGGSGSSSSDDSTDSTEISAPGALFYQQGTQIKYVPDTNVQADPKVALDLKDTTDTNPNSWTSEGFGEYTLSRNSDGTLNVDSYQPKGLIYREKGEPFHYLPAALEEDSNGNLITSSPQQLTEANPSTICTKYLRTKSTAGMGFAFYSTPGNDNDCAPTGDNNWYAIHTNMDATDQPLSLPGEVPTSGYGYTPVVSIDGTVDGLIYADSNGNIHADSNGNIHFVTLDGQSTDLGEDVGNTQILAQVGFDHIIAVDGVLHRLNTDTDPVSLESLGVDLAPDSNDSPVIRARASTKESQLALVYKRRSESNLRVASVDVDAGSKSELGTMSSTSEISAGWNNDNIIVSNSDIIYSYPTDGSSGTELAANSSSDIDVFDANANGFVAWQDGTNIHVAKPDGTSADSITNRGWVGHVSATPAKVSQYNNHRLLAASNITINNGSFNLDGDNSDIYVVDLSDGSLSPSKLDSVPSNVTSGPNNATSAMFFTHASGGTGWGYDSSIGDSGAVTALGFDLDASDPVFQIVDKEAHPFWM